MDFSSSQHHLAFSDGSEDEIMGRLYGKDRRNNEKSTKNTAHYSKQDILEQYCISEKGFGALDNGSYNFFGCLSSHNSSFCSTTNTPSILTACVRQRVSSEENLYDLYRRRSSEYAPFPKRQRYPWSPVSSDMYAYDRDLKSSYFRRKTHHTDPNRYTWMPSDDESIKMEKPKSITDLSVVRGTQMTPPNKKHVSFARSHTLTSFDDAMTSLNSSLSHLNSITKSQERLLEVKKAQGGFHQHAITKQPEFSDNNKIILDKLKRGPMKTQATQTEIAVSGRKLPPMNLSSSRVKMVSQAAQTNGINGRKLLKSLSEAGCKFISTSSIEGNNFKSDYLAHEPLHRTQSDEPPKSPFLDILPTPLPFAAEETPQSESSSISKSDDHPSEDSVDPKQEIFIDFKPQVLSPSEKNLAKKQLIKTYSDGLILLENRRSKISDDGVVPTIRSYRSINHEDSQNLSDEVPAFEPYFQKTPIKNEGICNPNSFIENIYSSVDEPGGSQDYVDDEFHENIFYNKTYERQDSVESNLEVINEGSPPDESIVPSIFLTAEQAASPFASSDSLANDLRDHSDGIWNESQVTVLQMDSSAENNSNFGLSSPSTAETAPDLVSGATAALLTPKSKRKYLLMWQHQQRSSIDIDMLDEEFNNCVVEEKSSSNNNNKLPNTLKVPPTASIRTFPHRRKSRSESPPAPAESPLPAVVPDIYLGQINNDLCKTDVSESTTTTDDYITATSGTDSSRKSASLHISEQNRKLHHEQSANGQSFDSIKGSLDTFVVDDMVVPSISTSISSEPRGIIEFSTIESTYSALIPQIINTGRSTPSDDSSSCGSYSVAGSTPDLLDRLVKPEEYTKSRKRRELYLDVANNIKSTESNNYKGKSKYSENKISPTVNKESLKIGNEKPKRPKARTRSPLQGNKKSFHQGRKSPHKDRVVNNYDERSYNKVTSDESSTGRECTGSQISPRKSKKTKEIPRRRSLPRSPSSGSQKPQSNKKSDGDMQPSSLPGSLSRRKSTKSNKAEENNIKHKKCQDNKHLPNSGGHHMTKEITTLTALSAESLRSISPGSDSVFYSDPSMSYNADHQIHCLHCGKEVESQTDGIIISEKNNEQPSAEHQVIVKPPAGFEDSPKIKVGRYKKQESKIKITGDDKMHGDQSRKHRYKPEIRAKSEERSGATASSVRGRLRPMQRSPYCSKEHLKAADSSPSILPGDPEEENDQGIYYGCYENGKWLRVSDTEIFQTALSPTESTSRRNSLSSIDSEEEFSKRYQNVAQRVAHRKPYVDMYKRIFFKTFECDKTIVVQRESGEFGFRIHGSKPVVVTAIEQGTPAESSGLEVGDIIIAVNGINVMDRSHSDVVQIAQSQNDTLTLDIARTSYALNRSDNKENVEFPSLYCGYLWKLSGYAKGNTTLNKWTRRWFCLKKDNCLYYYKTDSDKQPVGAVMLLEHEIRELINSHEMLESSKPNSFVIHKDGNVSLYLAADNQEARSRWVEVLEKSLNDPHSVIEEYVEETKRNLALAPNVINDPECMGYLIKLGTQWKSWNRRYCVLKDAALYFYHDSNSSNAFGVALLQGYKVQASSSSKKHGFEIVPQDPSKKHYYFHAETDADRKRWLSALEYSIDRWMANNQ